VKKTNTFMQGENQILLIPKEIHFDTETVFIEKIGAVTLVIDSNNLWTGLKVAQNLFSKDFMSEGRTLNKIVDLTASLKPPKKPA
jgi:virulence-associated protein VagC